MTVTSQGVAPSSGIFVSFEGGDGSGKSSQIGLLGGWFTQLGYDVTTTREPGGTDLGRQLRELILHGDEMDPRTEALLYAADRAHHVATLVRPALARGGVVITDRYLDSSVAYQGGGRELSAQQVEDLSLWATHGLLPSITLLLDIDPVLGVARVPGGLDRLERAGEQFHGRTRQAYLERARQFPERFIVIDASGSIEQVHSLVIDAVAQRLGLEPQVRND